MANLCIIRVLSSIAETNAPYNQFTLYRHCNYSEIRQVVIVCTPKAPDTLKIPETLEVLFINKNYTAICKTVLKEVRKAQDSGEKVVIHMHHPDSAGLLLIHLFLSFSKIRNLTVYNVHNSLTAYPLKVKLLVLCCIALAKCSCVVAKSAYETYPKLLRKMKKNFMCAIQNGFDDTRVMNLYEPGVERNSNELIYVARMAIQKNHHFLLDVIDKLPECKLTLVGSEDKEGAIRKAVNDRGLSNRVEFTGVIPRDEVFRRLNLAGLYVTPSLIEGLPVSLLEAACCGLAAIASNISSHVEIAEKVDSINIVELEADKWVTEIRRLLKDNNGTNVLGNLGQEQVINSFSLKRMQEQYDEIYRSLVGEWK